MTIERLLTTSNYKTLKGQEHGYDTYILHLAPAQLSGYEVCPKRSAGCTAACLNTAGRGAFRSTQRARIRKTQFFFQHRQAFIDILGLEIFTAIDRAKTAKRTAVFRLNGTSDLPWEKFRWGDNRSLIEAFPEAQFYDYTKVLGREVPDNYHLTFSKSENNDSEVHEAMRQGLNIAVLFTDRPAEYQKRPVIDGDQNDLRFLDPKGIIVGLSAKGQARYDESGFVVRDKMVNRQPRFQLSKVAA